MPYPFIIIPDIEEGIELKSSDVLVAYDDLQIEACIRKCSNSFPNSAILVYELRDMHKIKKKAEYQKYFRNNKTGEILPV